MVTYAIDFMRLSASNLMVLDRMSDFAVPSALGMRKRWAAAGARRAVMAVGCYIGDGGCYIGQRCGAGLQRCFCRVLSEDCRCVELSICVLRCQQN
jgi:hypothetical protein